MAQQKCGLLGPLKWHTSMYTNMEKCSLYRWVVKASCEQYGVQFYLCFWKKCKDQPVKYVYFCGYEYSLRKMTKKALNKTMFPHRHEAVLEEDKEWLLCFIWTYVLSYSRTRSMCLYSRDIKILENIPTKSVQTVLCLRSPLESHQEQMLHWMFQ